MPGKRIIVIANKWWEADPLCAVLINDRARPKTLTGFAYHNYPASRAMKPALGAARPADPTPKPRMSFDCGGDTVEIWCLEELMNPAESASSSAEKARVLPSVFEYSSATIALVVAFGTAGSRIGVQQNGSVVIGRRTFIHDPLAKKADRNGLWTPPHSDEVVESGFTISQMLKLDEQLRYAAEARFLPTPLSPAQPPLVALGNGFVSVGVVNITNYDDFVWADQSAVNAFNAAKSAAQIGSIETAHGIIRSASESPFIFVSGITDTEGLFDYQVTPRAYSQNTAAAHNAGVALAWLLPGLQILI